MKIYTRLEYHWDGTNYILDKSESFEYNGYIAWMCGATAQQNQIGQSQQNFMNQLQGQATTVFGNDSSVFQSLQSTFLPTIQAGPNQQGFSPAELSAMQSQAITQTGQGYKNAKAAVGNEEAAVGGGNNVLPSGVNAATDASLAENAANQTSSQLNQITQENYAVGRQNYQNAVAGEEASTGVFNSATSAAGAATNAGSAAANTANQIAQENNSWMSAVSGALSGVAGGLTGGLSNYLFQPSTPGTGNWATIQNAQQNPAGAGNINTSDDTGSLPTSLPGLSTEALSL
jgi:hypothetical protein